MLPAAVVGPLICGGTPSQPGPVVFGSSAGSRSRRSPATVKVERPWTNDLDRGEARHMLLAAEEAGVRVHVRAAPDSARWPEGLTGWGVVRGRPALSRCTEPAVIGAAPAT